MEGVIMGFQGN